MAFKLFLMFLLYSAIQLKVDCAKILGVFHFPSKSHHILGSTLLKALAKRGHEVTMISPFPLKHPVHNYEDIELTGMLEFKEENAVKIFTELHNVSIIEKMSVLMDFMDKVNEIVLSHSSLNDLITSKRKFDLVIQVYFGNDVYLALPYFFEASPVVFSTIGSSLMTNALTGNSAPWSYVPNIFPSFPDEMTFLQRVGNVLSIAGTDLYWFLFVSPKDEQLRQKYFPLSPSLSELRSNVCMVMVNAHYSIESPRPYVPNLIQVGGLHIEEPKELPKELKKFLDSATDGAIFFSLGSNVKSSELPKDKLNSIVKTLAKFPQKVLWKFELEDVLNLPSNVKISKWYPQRDILAHPNLKLFITHGGLLSTTEAVYHGVPMVGIPFIGDQEGNVNDGVTKGYVVKLEFMDLNEDTLTNAIREVLTNQKYRENVFRRSVVLKDQPLKPIDNAIFWVEYVLRHKGAHHLKVSALKLKWYQFYLLDVAAFLLGIVIMVIAGSCLILRLVFRLLTTLLRKRKSSFKKNEKRKLKSN